MSRQTSKKIDNEICHDNISYVATHRIEYKRGSMSRQKTTCLDKKWEECNKSAKTKKVNVATRFFHSMSTLGRICRDIKAHVATKETERKQKICRDEVSSIAIRN